jgi:predicted Zn-dependent protease
VTAQPGETAQSFAQRMTVGERALDQFLVLNGLESGAPTPVGQRFKIVTP